MQLKHTLKNMPSLFHSSLLLLLTVSMQAQDYNWAWALKGGGFAGGHGSEYRDEQIYDIKVGTDNNYYFLATFKSNINTNLNNEPITVYNQSHLASGGSNDIFLFSTTCEGTVRWSQVIGGGSDDYCFNLVLDQQNNVYIGATVTSHRVTVDGSPLHFSPTDSIPYPPPAVPGYPPHDSFKTSYLVKYNSQGHLIKKVALQGEVNYLTNVSNIYNLVLSENQLHLVVGFRQGTHLEGHAVVPPTESTYFTNFIARYDLDLNYSSSFTLPIAPESGFINILNFLHDPTNNRYYLAGPRGSSLIYQDNAIVNRSFLLAIDDQNGREHWRREIHAVDHLDLAPNFIYSLALDEEANIYIGGQIYRNRQEQYIKFYDPTNPNVEPFLFTTAAYTSFPMIAKLNSQGTVQWVQALADYNPDALVPGPRSGKGIAINGDEVAFGTQAANEFWGDFEVKRPQGHHPDPLLVRLNKQNGQVIALHEIQNSTALSQLTAVAVDHDKNYVVGGYFTGNLFRGNSLGIPMIISTGQADFFVAKLQANPCDSGNLSTEKFNKQTLSLYPNPTKDKLYINTQEQLTSYTLYDLAGKKVLQGNFSSTYEIKLHSLQKGVYLVQVKTAKGNTETVKIVKK